MPSASSLSLFAARKTACLSKMDKSSAKKIDEHAMEICSVINERPEYYTTSSCSGRCFLYVGDGIKSYRTSTFAPTNTEGDGVGDVDGVNNNDDNGKMGYFRRYRVNHDLIRDPQRYFDMNTLHSDPTGGGDPLPPHDNNNNNNNSKDDGDVVDHEETGSTKSSVLWLRFEPFILHVACHSPQSALLLMSAARPSFKNVGLTSWNNNTKQSSQIAPKFIVAIWGDEGLDMPLTLPNTTTTTNNNKDCSFGSFVYIHHEEYLAKLVNERHKRNWDKIHRFVNAVQHLQQFPLFMNDNDDDIDTSSKSWNDETIIIDPYLNPNGQQHHHNNNIHNNVNHNKEMIPKRFEVIGDVAIVNIDPKEFNFNDDDDESMKKKEELGKAILGRNKAIKVVALRTSSLSGTERCPGKNGLEIIAAPPGRQKQQSSSSSSSLITTHVEYGIKCVVDLNHTFFSTRMAQERLRLCHSVQSFMKEEEKEKEERILVAFAGVGMEALQLAGKTNAYQIVAMEQNPIAVDCMKRGRRMLERNAMHGRNGSSAQRLEIIEGDVLDLLNSPTPSESSSTLELASLELLRPKSFHRIIAPRPKQQEQDEDGSTTSIDGDLGTSSTSLLFLRALLPLLIIPNGIFHWYDFVADHEWKNSCPRTVETVRNVCMENFGLDMKVINIVKVGQSVAKRQYRICLDFCLVCNNNKADIDDDDGGLKKNKEEEDDDDDDGGT